MSRSWFQISHCRNYSILPEHKQPLQTTRESLAQVMDHLKKNQQQSSPKPIEDTTYKYALLLCGECRALSDGKYIHSQLISKHLHNDRVLATSIIHMYAKCGSLDSAKQVFDQVKEHSASTWNGLLAANALNGHSRNAIKIFHRMQLEGFTPNRATFATVFNACTTIGAFSLASSIYSSISSTPTGVVFPCSANLHNALLNTYCKHGSLNHVKKLFEDVVERDVVSWTILVTANAQAGQLREAQFCVHKMQLEGIQPNRVTFLALLDACIAEENIELGRKVHKVLIETGIISEVTIGTTLIDMYTKCGSPSEARAAFQSMPVKDVISWTAIISGNVKFECEREALKLFQEMQLEGVTPNRVTCLICLNACARLTDLKEGRKIHEKITESGFAEDNLYVGNALVDMYGSCGSLAFAHKVFDKMPHKDIATWNSLIVSYSQDGENEITLELYFRMLLDGVEADEISFVGVLYACSSAGLLDEGRGYYLSMLGDFGLQVRFQHCGCMLDLFSRVGWLVFAEEYILFMPFYPDDKKWMTLLAACKQHGDPNRAKLAAHRSLQLTPHDSSPYIVLSSTLEEGFEESGEMEEGLPLNVQSKG